jgi:SHS2 domain-containing protein
VAHLFFVKNYELIEHTADIGIKLKGKDLRGLFKNVALAMFDIIAEKKTGENKKQKIKIKQRADNLEELFINWLNELLSLSATKELIFSDFQVNKINERELQATGIGEDIKSYKVNTEVKAATYHQLKIAKTASGWQAEVIFDV